ncbi:MAG: hypothetical protein ACRDIV_05290 [Ktedonobacteraceae bacterium]
MQSAKTLWILDVPYEDIKGSLLVPLYAEDEQEAWMEAQRWALRCERTLPTDVKLVHFPRGFTMHTFNMLTGQKEESTNEPKDT